MGFGLKLTWLPLLPANCPFSRGVCSLGCPSFLPCCSWSLSYCRGSIRAEGKRGWLAHQPRLLQKMSADLAWFIFVLCCQGGNHHSCLLLRAPVAVGSAVFCWCKVAICHQGPIAAPCDLLNVHRFGQCGKDLESSEVYCCAPSKPPYYKASAIFMQKEGRKYQL